MKKAFFLALFLLGSILLWAQESGQILYFTEGVQFVNERVIVNNGDTTSYYYTYEIAARVDSFIIDDDNVEYEDAYCCKYYTSSVSYEGNDSIICRISPIYAAGGSFWVYDNEAYRKIRTEGRNLTRELGLMDPMHLYDLLYSYETLFSSAVWRYVLIQPEPRALKEENFVEIEASTCSSEAGSTQIFSEKPLQDFAAQSGSQADLAWVSRQQPTLSWPTKHVMSANNPRRVARLSTSDLPAFYVYFNGILCRPITFLTAS